MPDGAGRPVGRKQGERYVVEVLAPPAARGGATTILLRLPGGDSPGRAYSEWAELARELPRVAAALQEGGLGAPRSQSRAGERQRLVYEAAWPADHFAQHFPDVYTRDMPRGGPLHLRVVVLAPAPRRPSRGSDAPLTE
jgi:hypothetical protein